MKTTTPSSQLIDKRVILTMIICSVLALMVLAFRYVNGDYIDFPVSISVKDGTLYTDELIQFSAEGKNIQTQSLEWDFGDGSNLHDNGAKAVHKFTAPGRYDITLTIKGKHHEYKTVFITKVQPVENPKLTPQFTGPQKVTVGETGIFKDHTPNATKWQWWFGERTSIAPDATGREVKYAFREEGYKTVTLAVNDSMIGRWGVYVEPKPTEKTNYKNRAGTNDKIIFVKVKEKPDEDSIDKKPTSSGTKIESQKETKTEPHKDTATDVKPNPATTTKVAPDISDEKLERMLKGVIEGDKDASDFSKYMNGNLNITVYSNGTGMTFNSFCNKLREIRRSSNLRTFKVVNVEKDPNNYIKSMIIKYETRGMIGRIVH